MKTHFIVTITFAMFGILLPTAALAFDKSEFLILTRHRDSNGHLLVGPTQHQPETSVVQKTVVPAQPKIFERRSTDWGMPAQEVKLNEPVQPAWELRAPILEEYEQRVAYRTRIEGIDTSLTYTFYQDQLAQANYLFEPNHEDAVEYVKDYETVKNWITESYGTPTSVQEIWLDPLYRYDKSLWGQAVMRGHLKMVSEWKNETTHITLLLDGGNDTLGLVADFDSLNVVPPTPMEARIVADSPVENESSIDAGHVAEDQSTMGEASETHPAEEAVPGAPGSHDQQPDSKL